MRWSADADELLSRVPRKERRQVVRDVEKTVKDSRGSEVGTINCVVRDVGLWAKINYGNVSTCLYFFVLTSSSVSEQWIEMHLNKMNNTCKSCILSTLKYPRR